jgi:hypothetical protein
VVAQITPSSGNISLKFGHKTQLTFLHAEGNKKRGQNIDFNFFDPSDHHPTIPSVVAQITPSSGNISLKFGHKTRLTFLHAEGNKKISTSIFSLPF